MEQKNGFQYTYSATENQEVLNIRKKYLPQEESKLEELRKLDALVRASGMAEALVIGIVGCLVFGLGMCFCLGAIGNVTWPGIVLGLIGTVGMILAYPVRQKRFKKAREMYAPRILELSEELTKEA